MPLLPTTPFIILASFTFAKSSPRMHKWLTSIPMFGDAILKWETKRVIGRKAKTLAVSMTILSMGLTLWKAQIPSFMQIVLPLLGLFAIVFILSQKSE